MAQCTKYCLKCKDFHQIGPLDHFGLVVAMFVRPCVWMFADLLEANSFAHPNFQTENFAQSNGPNML